MLTTICIHATDKRRIELQLRPSLFRRLKGFSNSVVGSKQSLEGSEHSDIDGTEEAGFRSRTDSFNIGGSTMSIDRAHNGEKENWQQSIGSMQNGKSQKGIPGIEMRAVGRTSEDPNATADQVLENMNILNHKETGSDGQGVPMGHQASSYSPSPQPGRGLIVSQPGEKPPGVRPNQPKLPQQHQPPPPYHQINPQHPITTMQQLPTASPSVTITATTPSPDGSRIPQTPAAQTRSEFPGGPQYPTVPSRSRSPSPHRDIGFSAAVSNIVDQAHEIADRDRHRGSSFRRKGRRREHDNYDHPTSPTHHRRGRSQTRRPPLTTQRQVIGSPLPSPIPSRSNSREPLYRATSLETRSRSPSPDPTPTPTPQHEYYGSACLTDRSRSPSPASTRASSRRKRVVRKLPATPQKPSTLNLTQAKKHPGGKMPQMLPSPTIPQPHKSPGSINFPKLNASPTRLPKVSSPTSPPKRVDQVHLPMGGPSGYDTNDLNMPSRYHGSRERIGSASRAGSHDHINRDIVRERPRYSSQMLNNVRPDPRGRNNRFTDGEEDRIPLEPGLGRSVSSSNLPNGYKPGQTRSSRGEGISDHGGGPNTKTAVRREHSDSDDDDWC